MKLQSNEQRLLELIVLGYLTRKGEDRIIPEDIKTKFTPETIQFTLAELQAKGLVEYLEGGYMPTKKAQELFRKIEVERDEIVAWGHPSITADSETAIKITKGDEPRDGSVIGVRANKACKDLKRELRERLKLSQNVKIKILADGLDDEVIAFGSPALELSDEKTIVINKTDSIDEGTAAILANKSANDLKEELREKVKKSSTKVRIILEI